MSARRPVQTENAPKAIGPYSQGVVAGDLVFTSGQIPMTPSGELVMGSIAAAARQSLANVLAVLQAGGAEPQDVVKVTVYLTDMGTFAAVNEIYDQVFSEPYPARSCVEVARLPGDVPIEIEAVARVPQ